MTSAPLGPTHSIDLEIADRAIRVESPDPIWLDQVERRFHGFTGTLQRPSFRIRHLGAEDPHPDSAIRCRINRDRDVADIFAGGESALVDGIVREILPDRVAPDLVVHGALLSTTEGGLLCCGRSGAGKSTLARLFPDRACCDELVVVCEPCDHVEARSLPFWEARPKYCSLRAIFILEHAPDHWRKRLATSQAITLLNDHVYWPRQHQEVTALAFESLVEVATRIPVFRLGFRPDPSIWDIMTAPP